MCCAAQPPQRSNQGQKGSARSGLGSRISTSSTRRPSKRTRARSPGSAPGTVAPLSATPRPCASSATIPRSSVMPRRDQEFLCSAAAEDWRGNRAEKRPPFSRDAGADLLAGPRERAFGPNSAFDDVRRADLELRLDETDEP